MNMSECVCMYLSSLQLKTTKSVPGGEQVEFATHCSKEEWTLQDTSGQLSKSCESCHRNWALVPRKQGLILYWVLSEEGQFCD